VAALNTKGEESTETSVTVHQYTQHSIPKGFNRNSLGCLKFCNKILRNKKATTILFLEQQQQQQQQE
jgi:hypothetical protein